jgi:hypothetical protein
VSDHFVFYRDRVAEHVETFDLGVTWDPNAPDAVLLTGDFGPTALALQAHPDDQDGRCVVLVWAACRLACMTPPNDEAISGHRLWEKGLRETRWAGVVHDSELIDGLERQNRVHPQHSASLFEGLTHYVLPLKECVVEVVAREVAVRRVEGTTAEAVLRARR